MKQAKVNIFDRQVVKAARKLREATGNDAACLELPDGSLVTGKTTSLLGPCSAVLLNAVKVMGDINDAINLISPTYIEPVQKLKTQYLGSRNPRLHTNEVLIALSMCAVTDPNAAKALEQLPKLRGCQLHVTAMLTDADLKVCNKLGIQLTNDTAVTLK